MVECKVKGFEFKVEGWFGCNGKDGNEALKNLKKKLKETCPCKFNITEIRCD